MVVIWQTTPSIGLILYQITTISERHIFHIKQTQLYILFIYTFLNVYYYFNLKKKKLIIMWHIHVRHVTLHDVKTNHGSLHFDWTYATLLLCQCKTYIITSEILEQVPGGTWIPLAGAIS